MKKVLIGGFLSLVGSMGAIAVFIASALNMVSSWSIPPGRLLSTAYNLGMAPLLAVSVSLFAIGVVMLLIEYFRKEG
ncbi:MAG: hypothetical protein ACOX8S_05465 [Christensenellales bacterium]|jgi:hypothetical protein